MKLRNSVNIMALSTLVSLSYPEQTAQSVPLFIGPKIEEVKAEQIETRKDTLETMIDESLVKDVTPNSHDTFSLLRSLRSYSEFIQRASQESDIPPSIIQAIISAESDGNPKAKSSKGAIGLMQLTPITAKEIGLPKEKISNPKYSIIYGTRYFAALNKRYNNNTILALAAYNLGPNKVDRILKRNKLNKKAKWDKVRSILPRETRSYVIKVLSKATALDPSYLSSKYSRSKY